METFYLIVAFGLFVYTLTWFVLHATLRIGLCLKNEIAINLTTHLVVLTIVSTLFFGSIINYIQR